MIHNFNYGIQCCKHLLFSSEISYASLYLYPYQFLWYCLTYWTLIFCHYFFTTVFIANFFVRCCYGCHFCRYCNHSMFLQYFLSYGGRGLLVAPPLCKNNVIYEVVCWITLYLVYFYGGIRVTFRFLGYRSSPVMKSFFKSTFNLICCFPFFRRKTYETYLSLVYFHTYSCSYGLR